MAGKPDGVARSASRSARKLLPRGSLYKRRDTGRWYLKIRWPGAEAPSCIPLISHKARKATKKKEVALKLARQMLRYRLKDAADLPAPPPIIEDLAKRYAADHPGDRGQFNAGVVRQFGTVTKCRTPAQLSSTAVRAYVRWLRRKEKKWKPRAPATILNHLSAISAFCRWAMSEDLLDSNPVQHISKPRLFRPNPKGLSDEVRVELLERAKKAGAELEVAVALHTGMRLGELMGLRWADVGEKTITVGSEQFTPKGKRTRRIPINAMLREVLSRHPRGEGLVFRERPRVMWLRLMRKLIGEQKDDEGDVTGKPLDWPAGKVWHACRADVATRLARQGIDPYRLMVVMGWADLRTAQRYIEASTDPDVPEFERLD